MPGWDTFDTAAGYTFMFEWDGNLLSEVGEISGTKIEVDVIEIKQTTKDGKQITKRVPGWEKQGEITVKTFLNEKTKSLIDEFQKIADGKVKDARKGAAVIVTDYAQAPVMRFELTNAWIKSIDFGSYKAGDTSARDVTTTFVHEGLVAKPA